MEIESILSGHPPFPIEQSRYYQFYLREKEEVLKHKWVLSERNRGEVTFEYARWDWIVHHRAGWVAALHASGELL